MIDAQSDETIYDFVSNHWTLFQTKFLNHEQSWNYGTASWFQTITAEWNILNHITVIFRLLVKSIEIQSVITSR